MKNIYHKNQLGFAQSAVYKPVNNIKNFLACGYLAIVISFAIKGAFDNCNIEILKSKQINPFLINTIIDYFRSRYVRRKINPLNSNKKLTRGMSQGSVLDTTLSNVLYLDIYNKLEK